MDLRKLKTMIDLVAESTISELEVVEGESKIRISKIPPTNAQSLPNNIDAVHYITTQPTIHTASKSNHNEEAEITTPYDSNLPTSTLLHTVKCPMVGTFYSAPSPDSEPFVVIGSSVTMGQTIAIVEAMKLLNEIESDKTGIIKDILVKNGQPVQYGQPLFVIQ